MICDDRSLRIGSSNMTNRSLRFALEHDVTVDAKLPGEGGAANTIVTIRDALLAGHLGGRLADRRPLRLRNGLVDQDDRGTTRPYEAPELSDIVQCLADNETLDPDGPKEMFETFSKRPVLPRLRNRTGRRSIDIPGL